MNINTTISQNFITISKHRKNVIREVSILNEDQKTPVFGIENSLKSVYELVKFETEENHSKILIEWDTGESEIFDNFEVFHKRCVEVLSKVPMIVV